MIGTENTKTLRTSRESLDALVDSINSINIENSEEMVENIESIKYSLKSIGFSLLGILQLKLQDLKNNPENINDYAVISEVEDIKDNARYLLSNSIEQ